MKNLHFTLTVLAGLLVSTTTVLSQPYQSVAEVSAKSGALLRHQTFVVFPETRERPISRFDSIAVDEINAFNPIKPFFLTARPGEFFVYQIGAWAIKTDVKNVNVAFSALRSENGGLVSPSKMTCFNTGGTDYKGRSFRKSLHISAGRVQALWMGVDLRGAKTGIYTGSVSVSSGKEKKIIPLRISVTGHPVANLGYDEGKRLARLNWLNSTAGIDQGITKGYDPIQLDNKRISILGRTLEIGQTGLPASIATFFTASNQALGKTSEPIIDAPFRFVVEKEDGTIIPLQPGQMQVLSKSLSKVVWSVTNSAPELDLVCTGAMEFDGFVDYQLKLKARKSLKVKDVRLEIPMSKEKAVYMMGLNHEGGLRTPDWKWKWDTAKNQDMLWLGDVSGGLRIKWKAENYKRPLVNIYYSFGPLQMPPSWENNGKGGVDVTETNNAVVVNAYSGERELKAGSVLNYDFELLITPFKLIDRNTKFGDRYYQGGGTNTSVKIANAEKAGANIVNIHQAEDIYPFINYPYLDENVGELTTLVQNAHNAGMRMKVYYTTRELTKNLPEFWAFNSLNGEVIFPGPGNAARTEALHPKGAHEWLQKNVRENYIPAWYDSLKEGKFKGQIDLSVITTPDSRLNNFYIAGLEWMVKNMGIDGVYIDDAALDRFTLMRARKIIDRYRPNGKMDLHSWNHFNKWAGFTNCLNLYMELLPFLDHVWIGEARNYDRSPDHWLIEVSGIPFGVAGQMLEGGGNPWRGMVYGITNRAGWTPNAPTAIWKFWDDYGVKSKPLVGYWEKDVPLTSNHPLVKASVYRGADTAIIAVANWSDKDISTNLSVNWARLGLNREECDIFIPEINGFQAAQSKLSLNDIIIPGKKGYVIVVRKKG